MLNIPPSVNYASPLVAIPNVLTSPPREGNMQVPCEIDWGSMGGASNCVLVNLQNNATLEISQICALKVDNSACSGDVAFIFPDTQDTILVPAYTPATVFPVFSHQTQFYVSSPNASPIGVTRFQILNFYPFPADIPATAAQLTTSSLGVLLTATGTTQVIASTISGTLEGLVVNALMNTGGVNNVANYNIQDGTGSVKIAGQIPGVATTQTINLLNLTNLNIHFVNGLNFVVSASNLTASCTASILALYRTP